MQNFFALIKDASGYQVKRISLNQPLQTELVRIFSHQRDFFEQGIDTEVVFNGDWKPDDNEVLTLGDIPEAKIMTDAIALNPLSFSELIISNFATQPIKALFTGFDSNGLTTVYVQAFSSRQVLSLRSLPIIKMQAGNTFTKVDDDIFTIDNKLVAIIEGNKTKFKSYHNARMVFDLVSFYKEATDNDLTDVAQHSSLHVQDILGFIALADSQVRKMVHAIKSSGVLDTYTVAHISAAVASFPQVPIVVSNGKISLPADKKQLKEVLSFLLENIYQGALSGNTYATNSKRPQ